MKTLELVFFDAGGGHRSAADALREVVLQQGRPWEIRQLNLQDLLDGIDIFRKLTGLRTQDIYNLMLRRGWTLGSSQLIKVMHGVIRLYHPSQVKVLKRYWESHPGEMVVSLIPNFNRALHRSLEAVRPGTPLVTILTDLADFPPHFWIEPRQTQFFICGTERAYEQALEMGHARSHVFRTSGMILNPRFYAAETLDRAAERRALGLDAEMPTVLLMFGGEGSSRMVRIVQALSASTLSVQVIAVAGKNRKLESRLRELPLRIPMHVSGFTRDIPRLMRLSDVFIGKPGPGSISEAVAMGLPVLIERNRWTLPQERYNAEWAQQEGLGIAVKDFGSEVVDALRRMLNPSAREQFQLAVSRQRNRAVFEIPEILDQILG